MAQEDKGLVVRGILLLTFVGALATFVLVLLFAQSATALASSCPSSPSPLCANFGRFFHRMLWPTINN